MILDLIIECFNSKSSNPGFLQLLVSSIKDGVKFEVKIENVIPEFIIKVN